jgi:hypothetical protein
MNRMGDTSQNDRVQDGRHLMKADAGSTPWMLEREAAMDRIRQAVRVGDISGGSQAMADWVDYDVLITVYGDLVKTGEPSA